MPSIPVFALVTPPVSAFMSLSLLGPLRGENGQAPRRAQARRHIRLKRTPSQAGCFKLKLFAGSGSPRQAAKSRDGMRPEVRRAMLMKGILKSCVLAASLALSCGAQAQEKL